MIEMTEWVVPQDGQGIPVTVLNRHELTGFSCDLYWYTFLKTQEYPARERKRTRM